MNLMLTHHISDSPSAVRNVTSQLSQHKHHYTVLLESHYASLHSPPIDIQLAPLILLTVPIDPDYTDDVWPMWIVAGVELWMREVAGRTPADGTEDVCDEMTTGLTPLGNTRSAGY